ncbi:MAG: hypothetical protein ACP5N7_05355 [Candidatus Pacearchaeota archaeon]
METKTTLLERLSAHTANFGMGVAALGFVENKVATLYSDQVRETPYLALAGLTLIASAMVGGLIGSSRNGGNYN